MEQWKKVAWFDELHFLLDQVCGCVYLGKRRQQNALWEEGRPVGILVDVILTYTIYQKVIADNAHPS